MQNKSWLIYLLLFLTPMIFIYVYIYRAQIARIWVLMPNLTLQEDPNEVIRNTNRSLTVVTAFFNIGKFPKGSFANIRTPGTYKNWIRVFGRMQNPVVFYTDSEDFANFFRRIRKDSIIATKVIKISRDKLWPFQILPQIAKIYKTPGYPRHYPNTVIPQYTSMTHSKLPVLANASEENFFNTKYFCWLDVGYFRGIVLRNNSFWMEVPSNFSDSKIAVTRVFNSALKNIRAKNIIYGNLNWIGGGLFLGKRKEILRFAEQYKEAVLRFLNKRMMNVEQHILYAMFTEEERKEHPLNVDVQLFVPRFNKHMLSHDAWFYLGYVMYNENNR